MRRRKFIVGLGTAATGSSLVLGSGAFSSVSADRTVSVNVAGDNSAFLRMTPVVHKIEESEPATVFEAEDGALKIDVTQGGASGVNLDAETWIGTPNYEDGGGWIDENEDNIDWVGDHTYTPRAAFGLENRGTHEYELTLEYEYDDDPGNSSIDFHIYDGAHPVEYGLEVYGTLTADNSVTVAAGQGEKSFYPGKRIFSSIEINTFGGSVGDDLSGTLTITAEIPN